MTSIELRDQGMALADRNTPEGWKKEANAVIHLLAFAGDIFTAETVRLWLSEPPNPNAMGSRFRAAIRKGWITKVGYTNAKRPEAHARALAQYKGAM